MKSWRDSQLTFEFYTEFDGEWLQKKHGCRSRTWNRMLEWLTSLNLIYKVRYIFNVKKAVSTISYRLYIIIFARRMFPCTELHRISSLILSLFYLMQQSRQIRIQISHDENWAICVWLSSRISYAKGNWLQKSWYRIRKSYMQIIKGIEFFASDMIRIRYKRIFPKIFHKLYINYMQLCLHIFNATHFDIA